MSHKNECFRMPYISSVLYWAPSNLLTKCARGSDFNIFHALTCHSGGLTILRHHEIHDFIANLSTEVCHEVCVEPHLQPLSNESVSTGKNSASNEAMQDWTSQLADFGEEVLEDSFFDVRVFNPYSCLPSIPGFPGLAWVSASPPGILKHQRLIQGMNAQFVKQTDSQTNELNINTNN